MRVLVTGASGLIGGHLSLLLAESGFTVRVLLLPGIDPPALAGLGVERADGHVLEVESLADSLRGVQAVFHCDSSLALRPGRANPAASLNVQGTRNLLMVMSRSGVESLVHVGSASSFGFGTLEEPGDEESPYMGTVFRLASFDSAKRAQDIALRYGREGRVRCVVVNPTLALGSYDDLPGPGRELLGMVAAGPGSYPSGGVNIVGAREAAHGALRALGRGRPGGSYILGGVNLTYRELLAMAAGAMGVPAPEGPVGDPGVRARGLLGSLLGSAGDCRRLSIETARLATTGMYYSSERATRELGLPATDPGPTLEEACGWFRRKGDNRFGPARQPVVP